MATRKKVVEPPKKEHPQKAITNILMRIVAVFAASGLSVIGAGSVAGISVTKAITVARISVSADSKLSNDFALSEIFRFLTNPKTIAESKITVKRDFITFSKYHAPFCHV